MKATSCREWLTNRQYWQATFCFIRISVCMNLSDEELNGKSFENRVEKTTFKVTRQQMINARFIAYKQAGCNVSSVHPYFSY